ncbi:TPA_asm: hypothetical protein G1Q02_25345, partial [Salmonella enterica subsp. enterica serovar Typhimurium]|nr:hypothetical protein [Salmonella enterica subsp. enterica serovar Typhimurium]
QGEQPGVYSGQHGTTDSYMYSLYIPLSVIRFVFSETLFLSLSILLSFVNNREGRTVFFIQELLWVVISGQETWLESE